MRLNLVFSISGLVACSAIFVCASSPAFGDSYCRRCNACPNGVRGEVPFGYYPTMWRPWPAVTVTATPEVIPAPAPLPSSPPESAPPPKKETRQSEISESPISVGQAQSSQSDVGGLSSPSRTSPLDSYSAPPQ
jgi:hypothetical protein